MAGGRVSRRFFASIRHGAGLVGFALAALAYAAPPVALAKDAPPETVDRVDLQRYAGTWYEIAKFPNFFQRRCAGDTTATYRLLADGRIGVLNRCRTESGEVISADGVARRADPDGPNARLEVRFAPEWLSFLPFVWGDYWILDLAPDYSWVLVGAPDRDYLWILARTPSLSPATYEAIVASAAAKGFDVARLDRTTHGKPMPAPPDAR